MKRSINERTNERAKEDFECVVDGNITHCATSLSMITVVQVQQQNKHVVENGHETKAR